MTFPNWTPSGVIPAIRPGVDGADNDRSPYLSSLDAFFDYFCFSPERLLICRGLMSYRSALHSSGLTSGFQWLDGSFSENVEANQSRSPNDVDVVTFFHPQDGHDLRTIVAGNPDAFDQSKVKADFRVDAYFHQLGQIHGPNEVKMVSYWYSMWSHRRDGLWKGFVQVDLDPKHDNSASSKLDAIEGALGLS